MFIRNIGGGKYSTSRHPRTICGCATLLRKAQQEVRQSVSYFTLIYIVHIKKEEESAYVAIATIQFIVCKVTHFLRLINQKVSKCVQ